MANRFNTAFRKGKADFTISLKRENVVGEVQIVR